MSFPTKNDRQKCWDAKDRYWECLESHKESIEACNKLRAIYESSCPAQWVSYSVNLFALPDRNLPPPYNACNSINCLVFAGETFR